MQITQDFSLSMAMSFLEATERAALESFLWLGRGNNHAADLAAVNAMRSVLNTINFKGVVVIGEGERDLAPMLFVGEKIGSRQNENVSTLDIAVDPLEGTTLCAEGRNGALSVLAIAPEECLLHAPDIYMQKIVVGPDVNPNAINIEDSCHDNLKRIAEAKNIPINELNVAVLKRDRHNQLIHDILNTGAKAQLFDDGDVLAAINTCLTDSNVDVYMGVGGAPEGVLAAVGVKAMQGSMQAKLLFRNDSEIQRGKASGIIDFDKVYHISDLCSGDEAMLILTALTDNNLIKGIEYGKTLSHLSYVSVSSIVFNCKDQSQTIISRKKPVSRN